MQTKIALANSTDATCFAALHAQCFDHAWVEATFRQTLLMDNSFGFLSYTNDLATGFILCSIALDESEIITFGVIPNFRGKKISDLLFKNAVTYAKEKGATHFFIEVAVDNTFALNFYERYGFKSVGVRKNYYDRGIDKTDALVMRCDV